MLSHLSGGVVSRKRKERNKCIVVVLCPFLFFFWHFAFALSILYGSLLMDMQWSALGVGNTPAVA
jgi:hypothetical protein